MTLVGVVSADIALNLPDERAAERTYQLLVQAIGRAGRGEQPGLAIVQTYQPEHPAIRAVVTGDGDAFYDAELAARGRGSDRRHSGRLVKLTVGLRGPRGRRTRRRRAMAERLRALGRGAGPRRSTVAGPAPAYVAAPGGPLALQRRPPRCRPGRRCSTAMPVPPWSVDVDPESLL